MTHLDLMMSPEEQRRVDQAKALERFFLAMAALSACGLVVSVAMLMFGVR